MAMRLGPQASLEALLKKLEGIYGTIELGEDILAQFYASSQQDNESVVAWGFRLENILDKAIEQKLVSHSTAMEMLRSKFWTGLRQPLKDANRSHFEDGLDCDELRKQVRRVEQELIAHTGISGQPKEKRVVQAKMQTLDTTKPSPPPKDKQIEELKAMMQNLVTRMDSFQQEMSNLKLEVQGRNTFSQKAPQGSWHHGHTDSGAGISGQQPPTQPTEFRPQGATWNPRHPGQVNASANGRQTQAFQRQRDFRFSGPRQVNTAPEPAQRSGEETDEPLCFRCGRFGHVSYGCRAKKPLNG